jgi:thioredoxin 1
MKRVLPLFAMVCIVFPLAASVASNGFNEAVLDYNDGHYARALSQFEALKTTYPNNALVRYYDGLCLQATGRLDEAKSAFTFVITCRDQRLRSLAQKGLDQLGNAHSSPPQSGASNAYVNNVITTQIASAPKSPIPPLSGSSSGKVKRVLEFYADWCGPCKAFAPVFDEVKEKMRAVQFDRYNIDTPEGRELCNKYPFRTIPHAVFLDAGGNVLFNGSPNREVDSFKEQILSFK